jgi:hypothetical protein
MDSKKKVSRAIEACFRVAELGFDGLRAFILTDERDVILDQWAMDGETWREYTDRIACICGCGQDYFRMWLRDSTVGTTVRTDINNLADIQLTDGVYYVQFAGTESHYYVWIVRGDTIVYAGTDGTLPKVTVKEFEKNDYMMRFQRAMRGSMEDYMYVFCFEIPTIASVDFEWIDIEKSSKYV